MENLNMKLYQTFLKHLLGESVMVFLKSGVKLSGVITWTDDVCLTLARDGITQLVMTHAIATIMPHNAFSIDDIMGEQE